MSIQYVLHGETQNLADDLPTTVTSTSLIDITTGFGTTQAARAFQLSTATASGSTTGGCSSPATLTAGTNGQFFCVFRIYISNVTAPANSFIHWYVGAGVSNNSGASCGLQYNTDGTVAAVWSQNSLVPTNTGTSFNITTGWHTVEFSRDGTSFNGAVTVKIDGVSRVTGLHTSNTAWVQVRFLRQSGTGLSTSYPQIIDDFVIDNVFASPPTAGQVLIARQFIAGTPTYDAWTKSTGTTAYNLISDTQASATTNISASTAVAQTAFINSFSSTETGKGSGTIPAGTTLTLLQLNMFAKTATVASNPLSMRLRTGGADTDVAIATLALTDAIYRADYAVPTLANLNAGQAGVVVVSGSAVRTVEDMWVIAGYVPVTAASLVWVSSASFQHMMVR